jgi:hypothetical protein
MQNRKISVQLQRLDSLIKRSETATDQNIELQSEWSRYICVLAAGLLENSIKEIYLEFTRKNVTAPVANFVSSSISPIRSPKTQRFLIMAGAFSDVWRSELEHFVNEKGRGDAIDSIMANRHLIVHGQYQESRVSLAQVKEYLGKAIEVVAFIEQQCTR